MTHQIRDIVGALIFSLVASDMPRVTGEGLVLWLNRRHVDQQNIIKQKHATDSLARAVAVSALAVVQAIERRYIELMKNVPLEDRSKAHGEAMGHLLEEISEGTSHVYTWSFNRRDWTCCECTQDLYGINPHSLICGCCNAKLKPNSVNNAFVLDRG